MARSAGGYVRNREICYVENDHLWYVIVHALNNTDDKEQNVESTMRAIGFQKYGSEEVLELLTLPRPALASDTVLIRVVAAGVNPADWRFRSGQFRFALRLKLPFVPGADVAGMVEAVGPAVTRFRPGDAVYAMLPTAAGGGYAEYAAVAEDAVAAMPRNLSFTEAAGVPLVALTALQALRDKAALKPGQHVLIYGASGGVGSFALQIAKALGASVAAATSARNRALVQSLGADEVLDYQHQDVTAAAARYDVMFDAVNVLSFRTVRRALRPGGTLVTVNPFSETLSPAWLARFRGGRRLKSVMVQPSGADLALLGSWIAAGQIWPVIDRAYPLAHAADAQRYSATQRARGKLVLVVDELLAGTRADAITAHADGHRETQLICSHESDPFLRGAL